MRQWLFAAVVLGLLPACSSSSASLNPCSYVSAADVAPIVGGPVSDGFITTEMGPRPGGPSTSCEFLPRGTDAIAMPESNADVQFVVVSFIDQRTYAQWHSMNEGQIVSVHPVSGIGDDAFYYAGPHVELLFVTRGLYRLMFEVAAGLGSFYVPEENLARIVVPRLPA